MYLFYFLQIYSGKELSEAMAKIKDSLSDQSHDSWEKRAESVSKSRRPPTTKCLHNYVQPVCTFAATKQYLIFPLDIFHDDWF